MRHMIAGLEIDVLMRVLKNPERDGLSKHLLEPLDLPPCSTLLGSFCSMFERKGRLQSAERAVPTHCRQLTTNLLSA
jgi:hypothetical protein